MRNLPPIIDREIFFDNPEISGAQLSPDKKYISFIKPYKGTRNIWVKKIAEDFELAKPVTADTTRPIPGYFWSRDGRYILFVQDRGGNENFHVYALNPDTSALEPNTIPEARNLTSIEGVKAMIYAVPRSNPDIIYVGLNDRDPAWHDLYSVQISTGARKLIKENTERVTNWIFDLEDNLKMATRSTNEGGTELLLVTDEGFRSVYECNNEETCYIFRYHKDREHVYLVTNKGDHDLSQFTLFNPETLAIEVVEADPEEEVDFGGAYFSEVTKEIIATTYNAAKQRIYFKDKSYEEDYNWLKEQLPGLELSFGSTTQDEQLWLIHTKSDVDPGATYLFDREAKTLVFQYKPRPKLPTEYLAERKPVRYQSVDGMEIPAYLTIPKGVEPKNLPALLIVHGGPWARDYWGYDSWAQFWANRGYVVLQPNFRGSTGFGKQFLNAGNGEWGQKMQDDVTWGAKYLIEQGIADPERIGIMGASYGGYATLAGLAFTPNTYAAGVSVVGPSNIITLLDSIPPYWESVRKLFHKRMGNPTTPEGKAKMQAQSPLFSADKIKQPLMVVQGANDPRVKKAESDQIVVAMRKLGLPVEYLVAPDEGHGFSKPTNNMAFIAAAEKFFAKHLQGRFEEALRPDIAERLKEITVDINTVEMPVN